MSTAAATAEAPAALAASGKKGGAIKLILVMLVTAATAGGGAMFYMKQQAAQTPAKAQAADAEDQAEEDTDHEEASDDHGETKAEGSSAKGAASADYFPLSPQFVVNLNDPEAMRFLQIELQVIARKAKAMEAVKLNDPLLRNRLMLLFSSQTYHALLTREGKEKLQAEATDEINKVLDEVRQPHINGVVFTNFVMQ